MTCEDVEIRMSPMVATGLMIYGLAAFQSLGEIDPKLKKGLEELSHTIWTKLTEIGDPGVANLNRHMAQDIAQDRERKKDLSYRFRKLREKENL